MRLVWGLYLAFVIAATAVSADQMRAVVRLRATATASADTTDPTVTFATPNGSGTSSNSTQALPIAGSASDASGITGCTYTNNGGSATALSGTTSWSGTVTQASGTNTIVVTCTDGAGRTNTAQHVATYTPSTSNNCNGPCLFETSFTAAQGWNSDYTQHGTGCGAGWGGVQTGVDNYGAWRSSNGGCDQVTTNANYASGGGGRGHRHWVSDGTNHIGGGLKWQWSGNQTNLSICARVRYQSGVTWVGGSPSYIKQLYLEYGSPSGIVVAGKHGSGWGFSTGANNYSSSWGWSDLMGSSLADGVFHEFAYYWDVPSTTFKIWVDDTLRHSTTSVNFGSMSALDSAMYSSNLSEFDGDADGTGEADSTNGVDHYIDYDDIVVDTAVTNGGKLEC